MSAKPFENEAGISNQVAALILIAVAVVGGAFAYMAFRNQAQSVTGGKDVRVQSLDLIVVPSGPLFSVTVKNTGTEPLDNVEAELITSSGSWTVGSPPSFADVENPSLTENISGINDITLATGDPWDVSTVDYQQSINIQDNCPTRLLWHPDGIALAVLGSGSNKAYKYSLDNAWDISTATFQQSRNREVGSSPMELSWKPDGTKMYRIRQGTDKIYEYDVSSPWDISTATFQRAIDTQDASPTAMSWKPDGTKLYTSGYTGEKIYEYNLGNAWDISTATFQQSIGTRDAAVGNLFWKPDGTKLYTVGFGTEITIGSNGSYVYENARGWIYEYDLDNAWDISTATIQQRGKSGYPGVDIYDNSPRGLFWKPGGTTFYTVDGNTNKIYEHDVDNSWNPSTATIQQSIGTQDDKPRGLFWEGNGTKLYESGTGSDKIYEHDVDNAWDISTATFQQSIHTRVSVLAEKYWNSDGTKMYKFGNSLNKICEYDVSQPYDPTTATFQQSIDAQDDKPRGLFWNPGGTKLYEIGSGSDEIYGYDVSAPWDISTATFQQSIHTQDSSPQGLSWKSDGMKLYEVGVGSDKIYEYNVSSHSSGIWTSTWKDFDEVKKFTSLDADASILGASDVEVRVEVSDDGLSVKDSTGFTSLKGSPTVGLEGLDNSRYARLSVKLEGGSTPTVDSVTLNHQGETTLSLGSASPNETVSDSKQVSVDLHEGVEYVVRIVGYDDEGNEVLSKTMTVLSG